MSDDMDRRKFLEELEQQLGRSLTPIERDAVWSEFKRHVAEIVEKAMEIVKREQAYRAAYQEFVTKLISRQATIMPDFDAIREKKAEIDRKLLGPDEP